MFLTQLLGVKFYSEEKNKLKKNLCECSQLSGSDVEVEQVEFRIEEAFWVRGETSSR